MATKPNLKRDLSAVGLDDPRNSKSKRFLWPDALHRDFIAAVFEIGLQQASPCSLAEMLPTDFKICPENITSHIQTFRACMDRASSSTPYISHYSQSLLMGGQRVGGISESDSRSADLSSRSGGSKELTTIGPVAAETVKKQVDTANDVITYQKNLIQSFQESLLVSLIPHFYFNFFN